MQSNYNKSPSAPYTWSRNMWATEIQESKLIIKYTWTLSGEISSAFGTGNAVHLKTSLRSV